MTQSEFRTQIVVNSTKDLGIFKTLKTNRPVNPKHVERLVASIKANGMLLNPILVNSDYYIIDGQHRLAAAKKVGSWVYYIVAKGYSMPQVKALNLDSKNWSSEDFMHAYAEMGIESYIKLRDFRKAHPELPIGCAKMLCSNKSGESNYVREKSHNYKEVFNEGTWLAKDMDIANQWANDLKSIGALYPKYKRASFIGALITLFINTDFKTSEFIDKLKRQPTALVDCATRDQYRDLIEKIYNYRRRDKVNLRF